MSDRFFQPVMACSAWLGALLLLALVPAAQAAQLPDLGDKQHITFEVTISPSDPFSESNKPGAPKEKQLAIQRGDTFLLTIRGTPEEGWHTYPLTLRAPGQEQVQLSTLTIDDKTSLTSFQPIYPVRESEPQWKDDRKLYDKDPPADAVHLEQEKPFTWTQEIYVKPTATPGKVNNLLVKIFVQVCKEQCVRSDFDLTVPVSIAAGPPIEPSESLKKRLAIQQTPPRIVPLPKEYQSASSSGTKGVSSSSSSDMGMLGSIFKAILGGLVSLLTPCVFPMIPITVSYFLKQAERRKPAPALALPGAGGTGITSSIVAEVKQSEPDSHSPVLLASVYSATIVLVLAVGGLLLLPVLVQISVHYITNFVLGAIFLFFGLSLLGMYDITLPSWLQDRTAAGEGKGGILGVFFMALTFSIISFACVGPIYGGFLVLEASGQAGSASIWQAVPPVFGFSIAFASPFFLLALFPTLLKTMPRAGSWMNSVKVVLGFLELAAVVKFLRAGELVLTGASTIFTFDLSLGIYVALALACALYLLGVFRLPHDHDAPETIGVPRLMFSLTFLTLALYMIPGLFKTAEGDSQRPHGEVYAWIESFLLPEAGVGEKLDWRINLKEALAEAERGKKLVFIDFTGTVCTNCRLNERNVFSRKEVQAALSQHVLLRLYADKVPAGIDQKPDVKGTILLRNKRFGPNAQNVTPVYALVRPKGDDFEVVRVYDTKTGLIRDPADFVKFLAKD